jgi:large subunit ribosomal protein L29
MKTKDIRALSVSEMESKLADLKEKLFKQKIQKSLGQADQPLKVRETRKAIAKILTILTEKRSQNGNETRKG